MRISFQSKPEDNARRFVRISEFSFEAYPVQVRKVFRAVPPAPVSETRSDFLPGREVGGGVLRRVTAWLSASGIRLATANKSESPVVISAGLDAAPMEVTAVPVA